MRMKSDYTVLFIDDDPEDVEVISDVIKEYADALKVVHASNGHEGLRILHKMNYEGHLPCLVILDLNMPILNGKETLQQIKASKEYSAVPVVVFTTSNNAEEKKFALKHGADFVTKPYNINELKVVVHDFIERCIFGKRA